MPRVGPGPGAYMLPPTIGYENHDVTRYRSPQYSMGLKLGALKQSTITPGPKYEVSRVTKYGKISFPICSMNSRPKDLSPSKSPGPGTYSPEKYPMIKEPNPPAYSMSGRHEDWIPDQTPGPNQYNLPTTFGSKVPNFPSSAAYTMAGKHSLEPNEQSPGPAGYDETDPNIFKSKAPVYSMGIKHVTLDKPTSPGPAGYLPNLPHCTLGCSFGHRTTNEPFITAADNILCNT